MRYLIVPHSTVMDIQMGHYCRGQSNRPKPQQFWEQMAHLNVPDSIGGKSLTHLIVSNDI